MITVQLPDHIEADDGSGRIAAFTCLVKSMPDGSLELVIPMEQGAAHFGEEHWLSERFDCAKAAALAAQLEVKAAGGGSA